ncbi:hypothetical protein K3495_g8229 [Podosphaera aphanis]|nr:hypothetical protein K3495_g8229 [Podosphaera aphanis]
MAAALGAVGGMLKAVEAGQGILKSINKPSKDFYSIRIEIGDNQDAAGNPPSVILTDFSDQQMFGVFEGSSKADNDQCRNNKSLPIGEFDSPDLALFKGLRKGEAPVRNFKTNNGFNLKSLDFQGGKNAICISNIIIKGSDTQARRDEMFIPIGNIGFECGFAWNWGTILGQDRQRCIWLDGEPDGGSKPIKSLHLDMENIAGLFNVENVKNLAKKDVKSLCGLFTDSAGSIPNRNDCQPSPKKKTKRGVTSKVIVIDTVPKVNVSTKEFSDTKVNKMDQFVGSGFVTSDNKFFNSKTQKFEDISVVNGDKATSAKSAKTASLDKADKADKTDKSAKSTKASGGAKVKSRAFAKQYQGGAAFTKRETISTTLKVEECQATIDGVDPDCKLDETIEIGGSA